MKRVKKTAKSHNQTRIRLLLLGMALFSLTLSAFVTSTVAWFSVSDYLQIKNIELINNQDEVSFKVLNHEEETIDNHFASSSQVMMTPVSSMFTDYASLPYMEGDLPTFKQGYDGISYEEMPATASDGYYQLELEFTNTQDTQIYLGGETRALANRDLNRKMAARYGLKEEELNKIPNAIRVSFYSEEGYKIYEPNVSTGSKTLLGGRLDVSECDGYYDFTTNEGESYEVVYGEIDNDASSFVYKEVEGDYSSRDVHLVSDGFNALTAPGVHALDEEKSNLVIREEQTYSLSELSVGSGRPLLYIPANATKRMVVSIYLEGWDRDCVNSLVYSTFELLITFDAYYAPISVLN